MQVFASLSTITPIMLYPYTKKVLVNIYTGSDPLQETYINTHQIWV